MHYNINPAIGKDSLILSVFARFEHIFKIFLFRAPKLI